MTLSTHLQRARSYIATLCGFLLALAIVIHIERHQPPPPIPLTLQTLGSDFPQPPAPRGLSFQEAIWARIAWQYFINNTQPSGLVNAVDRQPYASLWSSGDQLMALMAAQRLGIIGRAELDRRLNATLQALAALPRSAQRMPWQFYHSATLQPLAPQADDGVTWSASDIGRLLGALQICAARYPEHGAAINRLLADWPLAQMFRQRPYAPFALRDTPRWRLLSLNDRPGLGYRLYAQATLGGITPDAAITLQQPLSDQPTVNIDGMVLPYDALITLRQTDHPLILVQPYILAALEYGFSLDNAAVTWRTVLAQESRYNPQTGKNFIFDDRESPTLAALSVRPTTTPPPLLFSAKAAFGWYALLGTPWSERQRQQVLPLLQPGRGWHDGLRLDGSVSPTLSAATNALILESLLYQIQGPLRCAYCQPDDPPLSAPPAGIQMQ
ncbi:DUF3131 domain-containing protein [Edwardsiella sp. LADL05-105]|uniref:DUF3131 domain-containing protein n=1 Tax=Edwardsiella sp. LADL05-105 TaxID=1650654 RepID=UPI001CED6627|nr:DUF3131 domain-containing protein [Edwardsiella sp. LADL05-105]AKR77916.2 DUF3131 domain-containing protein [Edwardsiella sp. LADL05-105]